MARVDTYSRMVLWLKVTLPLLALVILSTLFLVAETLDPEAAIPFSEADVGQIIENQGVTEPTFGGVTTDGVKVSLGADSVRPDGDVFIAQNLGVDMDFPNGGGLRVESPKGNVNMVATEAILTNGVDLLSTAGYQATTEEMRTGWTEAVIETAGQVNAFGPLGEIDAGRMVLKRDPDGAHLLVFNEGVRLIYRPEP